MDDSPILDYTIKYQLLLYHCTNNLKPPENPSERFVHRLYSIVTNKISSKVFSYVDRTPVFVARSIWKNRNLGVSRQEAYDVLDALIDLGFIKYTDLPLPKPQGKEGKNAKLYMYRDITLDKFTYMQDPRVKEARRQYWKTFESGGDSNKSTDNVRINISTEVIDYYISKSRVDKYQAPKPSEVLGYLKQEHPEIDPTQRVTLSEAIHKKLYFMEGSL